MAESNSKPAARCDGVEVSSTDSDEHLLKDSRARSENVERTWFGTGKKSPGPGRTVCGFQANRPVCKMRCLFTYRSLCAFHAAYLRYDLIPSRRLIEYIHPGSVELLKTQAHSL